MSTTYMNLTLPSAGTTPGPLWATEINDALTTIDAHNHTAGSGALITPQAMSITSDLNFGSNNATALKSSRYSSQSAALTGGSDLGCVYNFNGNLYYNNNSGTAVQITNGSSVAGSAGSISGMSGNVTVAYSGTTFVFQSDSLTPANIDAGSLVLRQVLASANGITLKSPNSLAASYNVTFPAALPGAGVSPAFMQLSSTGAITAAYKIDNSSLELDAGTGTLRVKALGITGTMIASGTITSTQIASATISSANMAANSILSASIASGQVTSAKLDTNIAVTGTLKANSLFVTKSHTNGASGIDIIRGAVAITTGAVAAGEGFTTSFPNGYTTRITFSSAFAVAPIIVFSASDLGTIALAPHLWYSSTTQTYADIIDSATTNQPTGFSFYIMGLG